MKEKGREEIKTCPMRVCCVLWHVILLQEGTQETKEESNSVKGMPRLWVVTEKAGRLLWCPIFEVCGGRTRTVLILQLRLRKVPRELRVLPVSSQARVVQTLPAERPCRLPLHACMRERSELKAPCLPQVQPCLKIAFLVSPHLSVPDAVGLVLCTFFCRVGVLSVFGDPQKRLSLLSLHEYLVRCTVTFKCVCCKVAEFGWV